MPVLVALVIAILTALIVGVVAAYTTYSKVIDKNVERSVVLFMHMTPEERIEMAKRLQNASSSINKDPYEQQQEDRPSV